MQLSQGRAPAKVQAAVRLGALFILIIIYCAGCGHSGSEQKEYVYVAVPDASLRDRVATVYNKTGLVHNGERLQVLEHMQSKRFVRVRTPRGEEGWIQERYLADQETFDQFQRLSQEYANAPAQGISATQEQVRVHDAPGRKAGYLYLLSDKEKVELLQRRVSARNAPASALARADALKDNGQDDSDDDDDQEKPGRPVILEDWWLVRDQQKRIGWVYGRALYLTIPYEVAQYTAGQRIVSDFLLDEVQDKDRKVGEYLVLLTEPKDGLPYDFNQVRVFTWNKRKHRYETAYRERNLFGLLPVTIGQQDFGQEGTLRTFTLQLQDKNGKKLQQVYKFNSPIVRKVPASGEASPEQPKKKTGATPARPQPHS
jgi:SH3-like domain-containing protein